MKRAKSSTPQSHPHFTFDTLVQGLRGTCSLLPDKRTGYNTTYHVADAALSAFAGFFMQSPSFLDFQRKLSKRQGKDNMASLFQVAKVPSDNQIRNLLDPVAPGHLSMLFNDIYKGLLDNDYLASYRSVNDTLLVALDGTRFFSSQTLHCDKCQHTQHKEGDVTYYHAAITPVIVAPGKAHVISLPPEFITPQDGATKQDSETTAAKRWLAQHAAQYSKAGITVLGDDLYAHQPLCESLKSHQLHFILTCKPASHKTLYEWVHELEQLNTVCTMTVKRRRGKKHYTDTYRFVNDVPLRDSDDAMKVNWCELVTTNASGKTTYRNNFITDHNISEENCVEIVVAGRARWKIENENNNVLKTKGYHLEHNFGHGKAHLSNLLLTLNLLGFLFHTVLHLMDIRYAALRKDIGTRQGFFHHLQVLTYYLCFESWETLMMFMMEEIDRPLAIDSG